jgi:hypothetical protein
MLAIFAVIALLVVAVLLVYSRPQGPCGMAPGVSEVTAYGVKICVAGPPLVIRDSGMADFRNGTLVDLRIKGSDVVGVFGCASNCSVVLANGDRVVFDSRGVIARIYPSSGIEVFSDGRTVTFPPCPYAINLRPPFGVAANGTAWFTNPQGQVVALSPDGTCEIVGSSPPNQTTRTNVTSTCCSAGSLSGWLKS